MIRTPKVRVLFIAGILTMAWLAWMIIPPWVRATVPERSFHRLSTALLLAAQPGYGVFLALLLIVSLVCALVVGRTARRGRSRLRSAQLLLFCISSLVAVVGAECAVGIYRGAAHWLPVMPDPPAPRDADESPEVNVVVIGGSAAYGLPFEKKLSTGRILTTMLEEAIPDRRFHLEVLAENGVHLERMHEKLAAYPRRIDLLVIYSGHNEFTYRFRWSRSTEHYTDEIEDRPRKLARAITRRWSPVCRLIQEAIEASGLGDPPPPEITRQLVDVPACTPEETAERLEDFRRRLEAIVAHYEKVGTQVVLLVPPSNDSGFEPNRSALPASTPRSAREDFTRRFRLARSSEKSKPAAAEALYRELIGEQPAFAETHFRLARVLRDAGKCGEANPHFLAARDLDALPMRCAGRFQDVYRAVAARHPCAILVDGQAALEEASPGGIIGDELFLDAMHPSVLGHTLLAWAIADGLRARRAFGWPEGNATPDADAARYAARLGIGPDDWKIACDWGATFFKRTANIRYDPSERLTWIDRYRRASYLIAQGRDPEDVGIPGIGVRPIPVAAQEKPCGTKNEPQRNAANLKNCHR